MTWTMKRTKIDEIVLYRDNMKIGVIKNPSKWVGSVETYELSSDELFIIADDIVYAMNNNKFKEAI